MEIRQKSGYVYTFHKYRNFEIQDKDGIELFYIELQEAFRKRWKKYYFIPRTIMYTDVPEMKKYMSKNDVS